MDISIYHKVTEIYGTTIMSLIYPYEELLKDIIIIIEHIKEIIDATFIGQKTRSQTIPLAQLIHIKQVWRTY